jgi:subtilisin family serine protease
VLDTGFARQHPDFAGRHIVARSFIGGNADVDVGGHGTHSVGIACGPDAPSRGARYGIAMASSIYVGQILDENGHGTDESVLAGIEWAVEQRCDVVSLSVGMPVAVGQPYSPRFERLAAAALAQGTLILAAAGNSSQRPDLLEPVEHPANCPSIVSVGAVNPRLQLAPFSNAGLNPDGGAIDLVAPGVAVDSAWSGARRRRLHNGTSTATAFVAGIAALLAEARPEARGATLRALLLATAQPLPFRRQDCGAGFVQAPQ